MSASIAYFVFLRRSEKKHCGSKVHLMSLRQLSHDVSVRVLL